MQQVEITFQPEFRLCHQTVGATSRGRERKIYWVERRDAPLATWYNVMPGKVFRKKVQAVDFVNKSRRAILAKRRGER
jgi:hypothetical protein